MTDIFEDLEKSIDDAFKPEEKKRSKKKGYMFNEAYDTLLKEKWQKEYYQGYRVSDSYNSYVRSIQHRCACGVELRVMVEIKEHDPMKEHYHYVLDRPIYDDRDKAHCPKCGSLFMVIGKIKQIHIEVY